MTFTAQIVVKDSETMQRPHTIVPSADPSGPFGATEKVRTPVISQRK